MREFTFVCPRTGSKVQACVAENPVAGDYFEVVDCTACTRVHLVNPSNGKVIGSPPRPVADGPPTTSDTASNNKKAAVADAEDNDKSGTIHN